MDGSGAAVKVMLALLFVQLYVVPLTAPLKFMGVVDAPLHNVWPDTEATVGVGLTVMLNDVVEPVQPLAEGVTTIFATCGVVPVLIAANEPIVLVPLAERPMLVLLLVQL